MSGIGPRSAADSWRGGGRAAGRPPPSARRRLGSRLTARSAHAPQECRWDRGPTPRVPPPPLGRHHPLPTGPASHLPQYDEAARDPLSAPARCHPEPECDR